MYGDSDAHLLTRFCKKISLQGKIPAGIILILIIKSGAVIDDKHSEHVIVKVQFTFFVAF